MEKLKNVIGLLAMFSLLFFACKSNNKSEARDIQLLTDSTAYLNNSMGDTSRSVVTENSKTNRKVYEQPAGEVGNNTNQSSSSSTNSSTTTTGNKGWSKAAQGAVIGGAVGAVGGAIISKKKVQGAIIGAAAGAAGGYIIGRDKDKKDGRVKDKQ